MCDPGGAPHGWSYDPPDESVGIFGYGLAHEDCPVDPDALVREVCNPYGPHGPCRFVCDACEQSFLADDEPSYIPWELEERNARR
jgi:hypothetical protein